MPDDEVIDDADTGETETPSASTRSPKSFSLATQLREFPALVVDQIVPRKKKGWRQKIEAEWASLREGFADKKAGTQKVYISRFRTATADAISAAVESEGRAAKLIEEIIAGILVTDADSKVAEADTKVAEAEIRAGDEVIDDADTGEAETQSVSTRSPKTFSLSDHMREFPALVVEQIVPRKQKGWRQKIEAEWASLREGFADKKAGTQKLYISRFRTATADAISATVDDEDRAENLIEEIVSDILIMEDEILEAVEEEARQRIRSYVLNLRYLPKWKELKKHFQILLTDDDPRQLAIGLMAITGRRFSEILSAGTIEPVFREVGRARIYQRYRVDFGGQLKTKEAEGSKFGSTYEVPVLAEARTVISAFERMRSSDEGRKWADMDSRSLNMTVNKQLNRALRGNMRIAKLWPKDAPLTLKTLRVFYAELAYHYFAPPNMVKNAFFAFILGHSENDYETSLSYMRFYLEEGGGEARREVERLQKLEEEKQAAVQAGRTDDADQPRKEDP